MNCEAADDALNSEPHSASKLGSTLRSKLADPLPHPAGVHIADDLPV